MFRLIKTIGLRENVAELEKVPSTASETYYAGEALVLSSGAATQCATTTTPTFISAADYVAPAEGNLDLPVYRVNQFQVWETPVDFSATPVTLVLGTKLELDASGLGVTDVATTGVATIYDKLSAESTDGDKILVLFE